MNSNDPQWWRREAKIFGHWRRIKAGLDNPPQLYIRILKPIYLPPRNSFLARPAIFIPRGLRIANFCYWNGKRIMKILASEINCEWVSVKDDEWKYDLPRIIHNRRKK